MTANQEVRPLLDVRQVTKVYRRGEQTITPLLQAYLRKIDRSERATIDFLVDVNQMLQHDIKYLIRMEPGVQTPEDTLAWVERSRTRSKPEYAGRWRAGSRWRR